MTVTQTTNQQGPSALTIYFVERAGNAAKSLAQERKVTDALAPAAETNEDSVVLDIKNRSYQQIWDRVQAMTGAKNVSATAEDNALLQKLAEIKKKAGPDRQRVKAIRQAKKDQERMLAEARGQVDKQV